MLFFLALVAATLQLFDVFSPLAFFSAPHQTPIKEARLFRCCQTMKCFRLPLPPNISIFSSENAQRTATHTHSQQSVSEVFENNGSAKLQLQFQTVDFSIGKHYVLKRSLGFKRFQLYNVNLYLHTVYFTWA